MNTPQEDVRRGQTSASSALADSLCPGRHGLIRALKLSGVITGDNSTADSRKGDRVHDALKRQDPAGLSLDERETYDSCNEICAKLVEQFFGADAAPKIFREERYWVKFNAAQLGMLEHSGQPDFVARLGTKALVVEYKTGWNEVTESNRNLQLRDQACLVRGHFVTVDEVGVAVCQPVVTMTPDICVYDQQMLALAQQQMFNRIVASNDPTSKRFAGKDQCDYCPAKVACDAYSAWLKTLLPVPASIIDVPMDQWNDQQWAAFCEGLPAAQKWLDEAKAKAKDKLRADPSSIPGFGLTEGRTLEKVVDPNELFARWVRRGGKLEDFMPCVSIGKTRFKEGVARLTNSRGKALAQTVAEMLNGLVETTKSDVSITKTGGTP